MQTQLNLKVKYRESFRPFAPAVPREKAPSWFDIKEESPYMLLVAEVRRELCWELTGEEKKLEGIAKLKVPRSSIPAVTHVDSSARVQTVDRGGRLRWREPADFDIGYRHVALRAGAHAVLGRDEWFVGGYFRFARGDGERARSRIRQWLEQRVATQPLNLPNAGSVFRNPPGDYAARLIESCGMKGFACGGAMVSTKHANFIVNPKGAASASDIECLIEQVREQVLQQHGITLQTEVRIIGELSAKVGEAT